MFEIEASSLQGPPKGFEKVGHHKMVAAAVSHGRPMRAFKLAIDVYRSPRHIQWNGALSRGVVTGIGVVAGCAQAMHLLRLLLIDPLDAFLRTAPHTFVAIRKSCSIVPLLLRIVPLFLI